MREVAKHKNVESIVMCEIDGDVIEVSKQYLKSISCCFDDPRLTLVVDDAAAYIKSHLNCFDVIICDSSDPVGTWFWTYEKCAADFALKALLRFCFGRSST